MIEKMEQAGEVAGILRALSNEYRLLILCALLSGPLTVGEINEAVSEIGQSAVSQHLSKLRALGMLTASKKGQHVFYQIADRRIEKVLSVLKEEYCS